MKQVLITLALSVGPTWHSAHRFAHANADIRQLDCASPVWQSRWV